MVRSNLMIESKISSRPSKRKETKSELAKDEPRWPEIFLRHGIREVEKDDEMTDDGSASRCRVELSGKSRARE